MSEDLRTSALERLLFVQEEYCEALRMAIRALGGAR